MKKLLLSTLFLLAGIVSVSAGSYNIWVCGQQVTDDNKSNIKGAISSSSGTVTGSISYSGGVLTLNACEIDAKTKYGIEIKQSGVTIKVVGTCKITADDKSEGYAIRMNSESQTLTIQGTSSTASKLYLIGKQGGLHCHKQCDLTIKDIYLNSQAEKFGIDGANGTSSEKLILVGDVDVYAKCTSSDSGRRGIGDIASITFPSTHNYYIPGFGSLDTSKHCVVDVDGNIAYTVEILKEVKKGLSIGGYEISNCNYDKIGAKLKKVGSITSDATSITCSSTGKAITLNGLKYSNANRFINNSSVSDMVITVKGTNTLSNISENQDAIYSKLDYSIEGESYSTSSLTINQGWAALRVISKKLTLKNLTLNITGKNYAIDGYSTGSSLEIESCKITAKATDSSDNHGAIANFDGVTLTNDDYSTSYSCYRKSLKGVGSGGKLHKTVGIDVPTTKYNVWILGHQITNVNPKYFGVDGYGSSDRGIQWDNSTKTLLVESTKLSSTESGLTGIQIGVAGAKIVLSKTNEITTAGNALHVSGSATDLQITTETSSTYQETLFKSTGLSACYNSTTNGTMTLNAAARVKFESTNGYGYTQSSYTNKLKFSNKSSVYSMYDFKGTNGAWYANEIIFDKTDFYYNGGSSQTPGCYLENNKVYQNGGTLVKDKWVEVSGYSEKYNIWVGGTQLNNVNRYGIGSKYIKTSGAIVEYNTDKRLKMNGVTIDTGSDAVNCMRVDEADVVVEVRGKCTFKSASSTPAFRNKRNVVITSYSGNFSDVLDVQSTASNGFGLYMYSDESSVKPSLTLRGTIIVNVTAGSVGVGGNNLGNMGESLTVNNATLDVAKGGVKGLASLVLSDCKITVPSNGVFSSTYHGVVPQGSSSLASKVQIKSVNDNVTAIEAVEVDNNAEVKAIYDAAGRESNTAKRGLNIIRMSDGTIRKVMVK